MRNSSNSLEEEFSEYIQSDYLTESERITEADVPVPDRLLPKAEYQRLVGSLKLSQKIGLLLWMNRVGSLTIGGRERLLYLQAKASFEAIEAGLRFSQRLSKTEKLQSDFRHQMRELNRRPQSKRFRQSEVRRIGVGYRDKGTLPESSSRARKDAHVDNFISVELLPSEIGEILRRILPTCLDEEGWIDLSEVSRGLKDLEIFE